MSGRDVWVPAVMSHLGITPNHPVERFWLQSSSGCAAATCEEQALLGACFELIERDAVAIAWLRRLPLRRLYPAELESLLGRQGGAGDADLGLGSGRSRRCGWWVGRLVCVGALLALRREERSG